MRRLPIAFILSAALALACWLLPPLVGISVDWRLPIAAFAIMAAAVMLTGIEKRTEEPDESPQLADMDFPPIDERKPSADERR